MVAAQNGSSCKKINWRWQWQWWHGSIVKWKWLKKNLPEVVAAVVAWQHC